MAKRDVIFYDGACGMCRRSSRWIERLDWLGRIERRDMTKIPPEQLPVDLATAMTGMPMRTRGGRVLVGYPAVRRALSQTPLGALPGVLLYVPGLSWLGGRVYAWIAANRRRDACAVDLGP